MEKRAVDWSIWKPWDFGLDRKNNMLQAPRNENGNVGELIFSDQDWKEFAVNMLESIYSKWCAIYVIRPDKKIEYFIKKEDKVGYGSGELSKWSDVGEMYNKVGFEWWGILLDNGLHNALSGQRRYVVLE